MNSMQKGQNILDDRASYELDANRKTEHLNLQKTVDKQENRTYLMDLRDALKPFVLPYII